MLCPHSVKGLVGPVRSAFTRAVEWGERQFAAYPEIAAWLGGLTVDWKSLLGNMVDFVSSAPALGRRAYSVLRHWRPSFSFWSRT